jgi:muramoyltetrapeptide carboxypeptidase LdcA involved in peptidoglycan recycling
VVVGDFSQCKESPGSTLNSPPVEEVLLERLGRLAIPVAFGGKIGHGDRNVAVPYGTLVELDTRHGTLVAIEGAVS